MVNNARDRYLTYEEEAGAEEPVPWRALSGNDLPELDIALHAGMRKRRIVCVRVELG